MFRLRGLVRDHTKDFYFSSILKQNSLTEICNELTSTECLDINVEKFLTEMADNFLDTVIDNHVKLQNIKTVILFQ